MVRLVQYFVGILAYLVAIYGTLAIARGESEPSALIIVLILIVIGTLAIPPLRAKLFHRNSRTKQEAQHVRQNADTVNESVASAAQKPSADTVTAPLTDTTTPSINTTAQNLLSSLKPTITIHYQRKFKVKGVTFDTEGIPRQTMLEEMCEAGEPYSDYVITLEISEYEGNPSIEVCSNGFVIGYIDKREVASVLKDWDYISPDIQIIVYGGGLTDEGELKNYGAAITLDFNVPAHR